MTLKDAFLSFLKDSDHQVRMKVAHLIPVLFQPVRTGCATDQAQPLSRPAQEMLFASVKQVFSTSPDVLHVREERRWHSRGLVSRNNEVEHSSHFNKLQNVFIR